MRKYFFMLLLFCCSIALAILCGSGCSYPQTANPFDAKFSLPKDSGTVYLFKKNYFPLTPGDTALFSGTQSCTVSVNGAVTLLRNDPVAFRTITQPGVVLSVNDTPHFAYPQLYQYGATLARIDSSTTIRYFENTDSAVMQVAFSRSGLLYPLEFNKRMVMPKTLLIGSYGWFETDSTKAPINNKWRSSPLIEFPAPLSGDSFRYDVFSVASKVLALPLMGEHPYVVNGNIYRDGVLVKSYYALNGETEEHGDIIRLLGTITVDGTYFVSLGLVDQSITTSIRKVSSSGAVTLIREHLYYGRIH